MSFESRPCWFRRPGVGGPPRTPLAFVALVMGSAGPYGAIAHLASQRTREFALRMALGATRREMELAAGGAAKPEAHG
jgi:hypothetical protein